MSEAAIVSAFPRLPGVLVGGLHSTFKSVPVFKGPDFQAKQVLHVPLTRIPLTDGLIPNIEQLLLPDGSGSTPEQVPRLSVRRGRPELPMQSLIVPAAESHRQVNRRALVSRIQLMSYAS